MRQNKVFQLGRQNISQMVVKKGLHVWKCAKPLLTLVIGDLTRLFLGPKWSLIPSLPTDTQRGEDTSRDHTDCLVA